MNVRVITWNLQKAYRPDLLARELPELLALRPDFVCLQEADAAANAIIDDALRRSAEYRHLRLPLGHAPDRNAMVSLVVRSDWDGKSLELIGFDHGESDVNAMIVGTFSRGDATLRVASVHQPAHVRPRTRLGVTRFIKRHLGRGGVESVVCGDFNTGFPRENASLARALGPEFRHVTRSIGATCYWKRLEPKRLRARLARWIGRLCGARVSIDHVFVSDGLAPDGRTGQVRKLPFEASDHLPVLVDLVPAG